MGKLLFETTDWTIDIIEDTWKVIDDIGKNKYKLDYFEPRIEIISYEHMLDIYASNGLPNLYSHWSFGRRFLDYYKEYKKNLSGLAYEVVINTNPCITYLMENNTMGMQALVLAHAVCGHGSFFNNNYLFKEHTDASSILAFLESSRQFITECEFKYGNDKVSDLLDSAHALQYHSFYKYKRKNKSKKQKLRKKRELDQSKAKEKDYYLDLIERDSDKGKDPKKTKDINDENILMFIADNSKALKKWERKVLKMICYINQYLYPQMHTQIMNEGWATFWHYTILNDLWDEGYINESAYMDCITTHTSVIYQPEMAVRLNPYSIGFNIFKDIRRMCENPTDEDREYFPHLAGKDWVAEVKFAVENFKDESFISQYLSPKVIRDLGLFTILDSEDEDKYIVTNIHNLAGYEQVRYALSRQVSLEFNLPEIYVTEVDEAGMGDLTLKYDSYNGADLNNKQTLKTLSHVHRLWSGKSKRSKPVSLELYNNGELYTALEVE